MIGPFGAQETLLITALVVLRLLALAVVVYVFVRLHALRQGLRKLQTEVEELRRDLDRPEK